MILFFIGFILILILFIAAVVKMFVRPNVLVDEPESDDVLNPPGPRYL